MNSTSRLSRYKQAIWAAFSFLVEQHGFDPPSGSSNPDDWVTDDPREHIYTFRRGGVELDVWYEVLWPSPVSLRLYATGGERRDPSDKLEAWLWLGEAMKAQGQHPPPSEFPKSSESAEANGVLQLWMLFRWRAELFEEKLHQLTMSGTFVEQNYDRVIALLYETPSSHPLTRNFIAVNEPGGSFTD